MSCWDKISGSALNQGDLLKKIAIPVVRTSFPAADANGMTPIEVYEVDAVILTQSCDLEQKKTATVLVARVDTIFEFEKANPSYAKEGKWGHVLKGRVEGLHLLRSPDQPDDPRQHLVVDFRAVVTLPLEYVSKHAGGMGDRFRLKSPWLEHFSQAFGTAYTRVALPDEIPLK